MHVASLELCRELYELSGWDYTEKHYDPEDGGIVSGAPRKSLGSDIPAYDFGYLLRKLPPFYPERDEHGLPIPLQILCNVFVRNGEICQVPGEWWAGYVRKVGNYADTPEDAATKLAIELFKQGILKKESA